MASGCKEYSLEVRFQSDLSSLLLPPPFYKLSRTSQTMRSSTLFGFGLSLSTVCLANPTFLITIFLHNNAGSSSPANITCATGVYMIVAQASTDGEVASPEKK